MQSLPSSLWLPGCPTETSVPIRCANNGSLPATWPPWAPGLRSQTNNPAWMIWLVGIDERSPSEICCFSRRLCWSCQHACPSTWEPVWGLKWPEEQPLDYNPQVDLYQVYEIYFCLFYLKFLVTWGKIYPLLLTKGQGITLYYFRNDLGNTLRKSWL